MKMKQHQHAQGAVCQRKRPVIRGYDAVLLQRREIHFSRQATWDAKSAIREL